MKDFSPRGSKFFLLREVPILVAIQGRILFLILWDVRKIKSVLATPMPVTVHSKSS